MADAPLATVEQFGAYLKQTFAPTDASAVLYLSIASGTVRDYLQQTITAVTGDVAYFDPNETNSVFLPEWPVTGVSLVETFGGTTWSTADPATFTVSKRLGLVAGRPFSGVHWPTDPESWRVTYDHGFAAVPDALVGVTLGVAARGYASDPGIDLERIGGYQVKYSQVAAEGFDSLELKALARYVVPRI